MRAIVGLIAVVGLVSLASPAAADPGNGKGKGFKVEATYDSPAGKHEGKEKGRSDKHAAKAAKVRYASQEDAGGRKYWHKVKKDKYRTAAYEGCGGPPPWAPAWGFRRKFPEGAPCDGSTSTATRDAPYAAPFGIAYGRCDRTQVGDVVGTTISNATSNFMQTKLGTDPGVAGVAGLVVGALVSDKIGRRMDRVDETCVGQVLEHAPDGRNIAWSQTDGPRYGVVPLNTYRTAGGSYCREYQTTALLGGQTQREYGIACRQPNGTWQVAG
jgi:surface antigen